MQGVDALIELIFRMAEANPRTLPTSHFSMQGVDALIELIFRKAEAKRFGTQFMTGPVLAGLVEAYVQVRGG